MLASMPMHKGAHPWRILLAGLAVSTAQVLDIIILLGYARAGATFHPDTGC